MATKKKIEITRFTFVFNSDDSIQMLNYKEQLIREGNIIPVLKRLKKLVNEIPDTEPEIRKFLTNLNDPHFLGNKTIIHKKTSIKSKKRV